MLFRKGKEVLYRCITCQPKGGVGAAPLSSAYAIGASKQMQNLNMTSIMLRTQDLQH